MSSSLAASITGKLTFPSPHGAAYDCPATRLAREVSPGGDFFLGPAPEIFRVKIFYGICGEGMGHAGRSIALVERLIALGHEVRIFTFADALQLLTTSGYTPERIEGLQFRIAAGGGVDTVGSLGNFCRYLKRRRQSLDYVRQLALAERPDLFITDFEPLTALAAASLRIPCVSIDNQHRFCHPLGADFPLFLQLYSRLTGEFVRRWIKRPLLCIVAVFHRCPASRQYERVDVLVREPHCAVAAAPGRSRTALRPREPGRAHGPRGRGGASALRGLRVRGGGGVEHRIQASQR